MTSKEAAPLTHELLARKGEASAARWRSEHDGANLSDEVAFNPAPQPQEAPSGSTRGARSIIVDRRFIAVALVIGLVSGLTSYFLFARPNSEVAGTTVSTPVSPVPAPQEESQVSRDNTPDPGSTGAEPAAIEPELVSLLPASGATAVEARREIPAPLNVRAQKTPQPQPKIEPASLSVSTPPAQTPAKSAPQKASVPPILAAPPPPPIAATVPTPEKPAPAPVEQATVPEPPVRSIAALPRPATKPDAIKADVTATKDKPAVQVPAPTPAPSKTAAISPPKEKKPTAVPGAGKKAAYSIQLASVKNKTAADREGVRLQKLYSAALGTSEVFVEQATIANRGTFYRIKAGGFASAKEAANACKALKAEKQPCLVVRR